jgi:peptidoglycan/xylan/chitin deacetylase (PgdA/CDA1 family)
MWHGFGQRTDATDPHRVFLPVETFVRQLDLLLARGSTFLDLDGYLAGLETGRWPKRAVLVTIDDGYVSTLTEAAPLLAARAVPAVVFALPGRLGGTSDWMPDAADNLLLDADGLRSLEALGLRVEVHGWDHRLLPGLPAEELRRQVSEARTALADLLGREPEAFAYPSGQHDAAARAAVREAGFSCAFGVHEPRDLNRYSLGRVDVNPTDTELTFRLKATRLWTPAYRTAGRVAPLRRGLHRLVGATRPGAATRPSSPLP